MIVCPVCAHSNDEFAIKCVSCGSYIQDRIPNIDFFAMIWLIIESPTDAFKKIIIAEHKNFVLLLALFLGIGSAFALMWWKGSGSSFDNLLTILLFGIVVGFGIAIPLFFTLVGAIHGLSTVLKGSAAVKETYAIVGWSLVPIMFSVVILLPLELGTLGLLLFSSNPSAYEVKPLVTVVFLGLDALLVVWSLLLAAQGIRMAHRLTMIKGCFIVSVAAAAVSYISVFIYSSFNI